MKDYLKMENDENKLTDYYLKTKKTNNLKTVWQTPSCLVVILPALLFFAVLIIHAIIEIPTFIAYKNGFYEVKKGPNLNYPRFNHIQATLNDGTVLIIGGEGKKNAKYNVQYYPELYNPIKNKFIKLEKTKCAYFNPDVYLDSDNRVIISEKSRCKNDFVFNKITKQFEELNGTVQKDKLKSLVNVDIITNPENNPAVIDKGRFVNKKKLEKRDFRILKDDGQVDLYVCDKGYGEKYEEKCKEVFFDDFTLFIRKRTQLKYSPVNAGISKISDNRWLFTGGSKTKNQIEVPQRYTQIIKPIPGDDFTPIRNFNSIIIKGVYLIDGTIKFLISWNQDPLKFSY